MNCRSANRMIQEYLDGEVSSEGSKRLFEHFDICSGCKDKYESMKKLVGGLESFGIMSPSPDFTDTILSNLGVRKQENTEFIPTPSLLQSILIWAKGAAVMAVVVMAFGLVNLFMPVQRSGAMVLSTDPQARVLVAGRDVTVPLGVCVRGNLTVLDGNVTLAGRVEGDVRIIRGSVRRVPGSQVAGSVVIIESPVAQAKDALMGAMDWFVSAYRQMTNRMVGP